MGEKHAQHNKKQCPHSLFSQTGNLPSSSCVSIRIFNLTSQIDIECVVSWATWRSLHGVGFHRIEDHGVTLMTVASWRGDLELLHMQEKCDFSFHFDCFSQRKAGKSFHFHIGRE
jgi:hypothetical protein